MNAAGVPGFEKLEGHKNYDNWKFHMTIEIIDYGYLEETAFGKDQKAFAKMGYLTHILRLLIMVQHILMLLLMM